jgi:hypothetical protein
LGHKKIQNNWEAFSFFRVCVDAAVASQAQVTCLALCVSVLFFIPPAEALNPHLTITPNPSDSLSFRTDENLNQFWQICLVKHKNSV